MDKGADEVLRFSDYDLFAYVATGLAALAGWDVAFGTHLVLAADWSASTGTGTVALAYVVGQILASPSALLIEKQLVRKLLGTPSTLLFRAADAPRPGYLRRLLLGEYLTPLEPGVQRRVLERAAAEGKPIKPGEPLFWAAFPCARKNRVAYARMETYLKLYGFCRNMAFVGLAATAVLVGGWLWNCATGHTDMMAGHPLRWAAATSIIGIGMMVRYLKFLRLFSVEVFVAYSEGAGKAKEAKA